MAVRLLVGDCRERLRELEAGSVHTCVTSPPYFGLRDYGVDGQIGLEDTPDAFVAQMVDVFREVRRVLRSDGTCWINLGDSYAGSWGAQSRGSETLGTLEGSSMLSARQIEAHPKRTLTGSLKNTPGLKPKDLMGMPWRVALALQADGWWLRQDIIWHKPNPMPESTRDRCTKAHEYLFLLSKSERYHYDQEAISEPAGWDPSNTKAPDGWDTGEGGHGSFHRDGREKGKKAHLPGNRTHRGADAYEDGDEKHRTKVGLVAYAERERARSRKNSFARGTKDSGGVTGEKPQFRPDREPIAYEGRRNKRSVWTVATQPFKEAHFATYPPELIEP